LIALPAGATLIDRGGGLIYDTVLDVTWLQDANYLYTSGGDADGRMPWDDVAAWVAGLEYYDSVRDTTWTDWRLPDAHNYWDGSGPVEGYNATGSEMGHLYYVDGVTPGSPDLFTNVVSSLYASQTEYDSSNAWYFGTNDGYQGYMSKAWYRYAWPVMEGDVAVIPERGTAALLMLGFVGLAAGRRRQH
jgi:hypothetical protein